jgi:hypothetical protein
VLCHLIISYYLLFLLLNIQYAKQMLWYLEYYVPFRGIACLYCYEPLIFRNSGCCLYTRFRTISNATTQAENEHRVFRVRIEIRSHDSNPQLVEDTKQLTWYEHCVQHLSVPLYLSRTFALCPRSLLTGLVRVTHSAAVACVNKI